MFVGGWAVYIPFDGPNMPLRVKDVPGSRRTPFIIRYVKKWNWIILKMDVSIFRTLFFVRIRANASVNFSMLLMKMWNYYTFAAQTDIINSNVSKEALLVFSVSRTRMCIGFFSYVDVRDFDRRARLVSYIAKFH